MKPIAGATQNIRVFLMITAGETHHTLGKAKHEKSNAWFETKA
jgi:hypothetical protein